jgi:putative chitinase
VAGGKAVIDWLIQAGVPVTQAKRFAEPLKAAMALYDISTPARRSGFLAQALYESNNFTRLEENLWYTTEKAAVAAFGKRVIPHLHRILRNPQALANFVYANRLGNGDEASDEGWKFRGRGIFQLTGKVNYLQAGQGIGLNAVYIHNPAIVSEPSDACLTAAWFWQSKGCNQLVDQDRFDATTTVINGKARLHADRRLKMFTSIQGIEQGSFA